MRHVATILGLSVFLCVARPINGQEQPSSPSWKGTEIFGMILRVAGLKPIQEFNEWDASPGETLLVAMGDLRCLDKLKWNEFLDKGGAVLLASDQEKKLDSLQVEISGFKIRQPRPDAYFKLENCPLLHLEPTLDANHPLLRNIAPDKGLATNGPSSIHIGESRLVKQVEFPHGCWRVGEQDPVEPQAFMVGSSAGSPPSGRVLVLAGQGVFFNSMLLAPDNINYMFARNCVHWLKEGPTKPRTHVLFVHDGEVVKSFALPKSFLSPMPGQPPIPAAVLADRLLRLIEQERILQQILEENVGLNNILQALLLTASGGLLLFGSWRLARGMLRVDTTVPLLIEPIPPAEPGASPVQLREKELARLNNYAEPAQALARQWFHKHAGVAPMAWDEPGFRVPSWKVRGSFWQRWRFHGLVRYLRDVAMQGPPMNGRRFQGLHELVGQLDKAIAREELAWHSLIAG